MLGVLALACCRPHGAAADHAGGGCKDDIDCNLNGHCSNASCVCAAPWGGPTCDVLQIIPSPVEGAGIYGVAPNVTSWGGNIVRWADGKYHLFVSEIAEQCRFAEWHTNSYVAHAVSDTPDGTYVKAEGKAGVAVQSWAHNPQAIAFGGELFLFHIGPGDGTAQTVNCSVSPASPASPASAFPAGFFDGAAWAPPAHRARMLSEHGVPGSSSDVRSHRWAATGRNVVSIRAAPGPDGPWTLVNGTVACDNPSPLVLRNGTVLLMCSRSPGQGKGPHWRLYSAATPRGPWQHAAEIFPRSNRTNDSSEDPFIWEDPNGNLHALSHTGPRNGDAAQPSTVVSIHGFSRPPFLTWFWSANQPYGSTIHFADGSSTHHATAERPKLVLDGSGNPTHLVNGLTNWQWPCSGCHAKNYTQVCNKCKLTRGKDYTYTIMRVLKQ